MHCKWIWHL
jgi:histidinol phosphatase-like PHP family hydrolase